MRRSIARPLDNTYISDWLFGVREKLGQKIIVKKGATQEVVDVLECNGAIGFVADQNAGSKAVFVDFSAPWCVWCRRLDEYLHRPRIAMVFDSAFVGVKIDIDRYKGGKELLAKLQSDVLSDAAVDYVLDRVGHEIRKRFAALDGEMDSMRRRKAKLESELRNLGQAFVTGLDSPTLRAEIAKREAELSSITQKTLGRNKDSVHAQVSGLRKFVEHNLRHIRRLISGKCGNPIVVRQELAKHIESIKLFPEGKGREIRYKGSSRILGRRLQGVCRGREIAPYRP